MPTNSSASAAIPVGRDLADERAFLDDEHAVRQLANELERLLHQHDGEAAARAQPQQRVADLIDDRGLDAFGRFVQQDDAGFGAQAARHGENLLLAAAQYAARAIDDRLEPREVFEHGRDRVVRLGGADGAHAQVVAHGQAGEDLTALRHEAQAPAVRAGAAAPRNAAALERHAAAGGADMAGERAQQRRLAHAVVPEHTDEFAASHGEIDPHEDRNTAVAGLQSGDLEHRWQLPCSLIRPHACRGRHRERDDRAAPSLRRLPSAPVPDAGRSRCARSCG